MKFHQVILELSRKRGKIAYLYQVHWPLTLDVGRISRPKSNQFIYSWWWTPVPSLMKFHQVILELSRKRKNPDGDPDGNPDGRTDGQPGNIMPPAPSVRRHNKIIGKVTKFGRKRTKTLGMTNIFMVGDILCPPPPRLHRVYIILRRNFNFV